VWEKHELYENIACPEWHEYSSPINGKAHTVPQKCCFGVEFRGQIPQGRTIQRGKSTSPHAAWQSRTPPGSPVSRLASSPVRRLVASPTGETDIWTLERRGKLVRAAIYLSLRGSPALLTGTPHSVRPNGRQRETDGRQTGDRRETHGRRPLKSDEFGPKNLGKRFPRETKISIFRKKMLRKKYPKNIF
jgi:hypothetical protein